uniref:Mucin-5AC n=1 Tax=Sphenodon punctatus TaxID=8508 RepID=A0A8D0GA20_SPHPU
MRKGLHFSWELRRNWLLAVVWLALTRKLGGNLCEEMKAWVHRYDNPHVKKISNNKFLQFSFKSTAFNPAHNGRVCSTWGNFNFKTFDGDIFYFPGLCNYVFASHCKSVYEEFNIQIRRILVEKIPTLNHITMKLDGVVLEIAKDYVVLNGNRVQMPYSQSGVIIERSSIYVKVTAKIGLVFMWDEEQSILLEMDEKYANQTCGLCGDFNGNPTYDEFYSNDVKLTAVQFGNMQKMDGPTEVCQDPMPSSPGNCTDNFDNICHRILTGPSFFECNAMVEVNKYIESCVQDLCRCDQSQNSFCICNTIAEYSRQCAHAGGQPQNWRTQELCPKTCPFNMQYQECGSSCSDTCTNPDRSQFCEDHCMDGCFCPPGTVFDDINNSGCIPLQQCSCTYNGNSYAPGTSYSGQCHSCTCTGGQWSCKDISCPGTCSVEGGSHISTFDEKHYTIHGDCSYVISKLCTDDTFTVLGELRKCGLTDTETCLKSVVLSINGGQTIIVIKSGGGVFVNWIYTQLPISAANVTMFRPSSFFTIIQTNLGIQLEIQLIPIMQVYVHLDPSFKDQTCGLCGNFNNVQLDDFKAMSGVVEGTAAAFANTWKTLASCPDIKNNFENPCSLSIENEKYAQHWCGLLTDSKGPFAECHSAVNTAVYHSNCMFDTCNCEKSEDCLCAALSSYVRACANKGVFLSGWRTNICSKYSTSCPKSLSYSYSISSCQPTCRSLSEPDVTCNIKIIPVDGCTCEKGTYMDEYGKCVPASMCPCYYKGSPVPSGEVVHENGLVCACAQGKLNCIGALDPKPVCAAPMVYFDCRNATVGTPGAECQKSCQTLDMLCYSTQCMSGCMCPAGLVSDGKGNCIAEEECPCVHNDATYQPGEKIKVDCNTCVCKNRMWECSKEKCLGTCAVYGDGHYVTFDDKRYNFNGDCEYTLIQDHCTMSSSVNGTFRVITENIPCGTTGTTCSKSIKIFMGSYELKLSDEHFEVVKRGYGNQLPYKLRYMGIYLMIEINNGLILLWDKKTSIFIKLSPDFKGQVCGLCGNYDGNGINDFTTRSQSVVGDVLEFGNSWKASPTCPDAKCIKDPCSKNPYRKSWSQKQCSIINSQVFAACHSQVEPTRYYEACVTDACACDAGGDCECFCTAVAAYAQACSEVGVCVSWRTPSICPMFCDYYNPEGGCEWHYKACGAPCMKTCRNPSGRCLHMLPGLEGCYPHCPANKPYFSEDEMKCVEQCGCYDGEGNYHQPGTDFYSRENCQKCKCSNKGVECNFDAEACYCYYEGNRYAYKDVIYNTNDGIGGCITAICDVNGTIQRKVTECIEPTTTPPFTFTTVPVTTKAPATIGCVHRECVWSEWFDISYPEFGLNNGDFETFENIRAEGHSVCKAPSEVECRAKRFPDTPIEELNQKLECTTSHGLICNNKDQIPPICYNYEIKILCCSFVSCQTSTSTPTLTSGGIPTVTATSFQPTPSSKPTASTGTWGTTGESTTVPGYTTTLLPPVSLTTTIIGTTSTETPSITSGNTPTVTATSLQSTPFSKPTASIGTEGTTEESTTPRSGTPTLLPPLPKTTATTVIASTQPTTCEPKCQWTQWFDVHKPSSDRQGGDLETYENIEAAGEKLCKKPQNIECRAENYPEQSIDQLEQKVQCNVDLGLICKNQDQSGKFKMCYNYQIKVYCCDDYTHCGGMTTIIATKASSTATPPFTSQNIPTVTATSLQSTPFSKPTALIGTATTRTGAVTPTTTIQSTPCQPKCAWSSWLDAHEPSSAIQDGDLETYENIRAAGGEVCEKPRDIECRAEDYPNVPIDQVGQKVQCDLEFGFVCRNEEQSGKLRKCFNYQIRVLCCDDYSHCPETTPATTTPTGSVAPPSTPSGTVTGAPPVSSLASTSPPIVWTSTEGTTLVSTSPGATPKGETSTTGLPPIPTVTGPATGTPASTSSTSTSGTPLVTGTPPSSSTGSTPPGTKGTATSQGTTQVSTSPGTTTPELGTTPLPPLSSTTGAVSTTRCQPKCAWSSWLDAHEPSSAIQDGDLETYENIRAAGGEVCEKPRDIECRAEDYPDVPIDQVGQKVQCDSEFGFVCKNEEQSGKLRQCFNYQIRVLCCDDYSQCLETTPATTTPTGSVAPPSTPSGTVTGAPPVSSLASTSPPIVWTSTEGTTLVSTSPGATPKGETSTTGVPPIPTVTGPATETPASTSSAGITIITGIRTVFSLFKRHFGFLVQVLTLSVSHLLYLLHLKIGKVSKFAKLQQILKLRKNVQCNKNLGLIFHNIYRFPPISYNYQIKILRCNPMHFPFCLIGEVIYNRTDSSGCSFHALCSKNCEIERSQGSCPETTTSVPTTPSATTTAESSTKGCPDADPPRKTNESWMVNNCTMAICEGDNRIALVLPPPVEEISCASGRPPVKVYEEDRCNYHYECDCICSGWGNSHYLTFDGTHYIFHDNCTYVLVKEIVTKHKNLSVLLDNYFCDAADGVSCPRSIIVNYDSNEILLVSQIQKGEITNKVKLNGFCKDGISVAIAGTNMIVEIRDILASITFNGLTFSIKLPFNTFSHNTEGQCGTCSNDRSDECRLPNGNIASSCSEMAAFWKVPDSDKPYCEGPPTPPTPTPTPTSTQVPCRSTPLCELIMSDIFAECHEVLSPTMFYENCISDSCQNSNASVPCSSLEIYASLCTDKGVCTDWRSKTHGECCKLNTNQISERVAEGCFCPDDKILFNSYTDICVFAPCGTFLFRMREEESNCQECVCDPFSVTVQCKPLTCQTPPETPACEKEGFVPTAVLTAENPCCPETECRCNISACSSVKKTCEPGYQLVSVLSEGDCCITYTCGKYSLEARAMQHNCTCCQELKSHKREVTLTCRDGTSINYDYIYVDQCQCMSTCIS